MTAAVSIAGVSKVFNAGRADAVTALSDVDLTVDSGQFVSLIGPSGCGKSTLLRLIADLIEPTAGTVTVAGKPARQARRDQEYGIAFQQAGLFEWRTVRRNVELPLELRKTLAVHPPLLLMDEPFGALDEMTRERLQGELLQICAKTKTSTVFVTHSISEAVFLSDKVVVMSARPGRITASIDIALGLRDEAVRQSTAYFDAITAVRKALRS